MENNPNKIVKIDSVKSGKVAFTFKDGERLSIVFDFGTYTENHLDYEKCADEMNGKRVAWESTTVEAYGAPGDKINEYLEKEYGQAPAPHVPVEDIPKIIEYCTL